MRICREREKEREREGEGGRENVTQKGREEKRRERE